MSDATPGLGHNLPPEETPPMTVQDRLARDHAQLAARIKELEALADAAPAEVKDEETFKPLSDLLKAGRVALSASEAARKIENEESRRTTAMIDAWFKNPATILADKLKALKDRTDAYLDDKKAAEEKRRKAEADRKIELAKEKAEDALWAEARGELAAYDARKADERAAVERLRKEAAARRADHLRDQAKRLKAVEPYLAARAERRRKAAEARAEATRKAAADDRARLEAEGDHRLVLEAEDRRRADEAARVAAARQKTADELKVAQAETAQARRAETKASGQADLLAEQAEEHADEAEDLGDAADRLQGRADKAVRRANASPADMSRTRSEMGTTSSVSKTWQMTSLDRDALDLNLLRGFLHPDAVAVAARGYMMAHRNDPGGPKLEGAVFEQVEEGVYR